jgi:DNA-binding NtrC family response regulator
MQMVEARTYDNRLIMLVPQGHDPASLLGPTLRNIVYAIPVPGTAERATELPRLIQETIAEQASRLQATRSMLTDEDLDRLHRIRWTKNLLEIEECVSKLIACRLYQNTRKTAEVLGYKSAGTISTWAKNYGFKIKK